MDQNIHIRFGRFYFYFDFFFYKDSSNHRENRVESSRVQRRASISARRAKGPKARGPRRTRCGPRAPSPRFSRGPPTSAVAVGSARTTGFLNAANDDAYTPLLSVSFPPRRVRLACSCSLRVSSRFFFTVLYNRQSPVLRGPGPESPALLPFLLSLTFSLSARL